MDSPIAFVIYFVVLALVVAVAWRVIRAIVRRLPDRTAAAHSEKVGQHDALARPKH